MENINEGLVNFNEMSAELLNTFDPNTAKEQSKELAANLLLMIGVPFFLERLKDKLPEDLFTKLSNLAKDPENFGANSLKLAKELFDDKIVQPLKGQLLKQMDDYIPALKNLSDIDLSKLSIKDVQDLFTKQIIQKMKDNLPPEIASKLPENFTQEDILNSLKDIGADKALEFARANLPPEAYRALEANKDLIKDPARIADYMKGQFDDVKSNLADRVSQFKSEAYSRLNEIKENIKGEIDRNVQPFKDKIEQLKTAKQDLQDRLVQGKQDLENQMGELKDRANQFIRENPSYTKEQFEPFRNERDAIRQKMTDIENQTKDGLTDLDSQISDNNSSIEDITNNLVQKAYNLRNTISSGVDEFTQNAKNKIQQGMQKAQQLKQETEKTVNDTIDAAKSETAKLTDKSPMTFLDENIKKTQAELKRKPSSFTPDEAETPEETTSVWDRVTSFFKPKQASTPKLSSQKQILEEDPENVPSRLTFVSPDEAESGFSDYAINMVSKNPALASYFGSELNSDITLDASNKTIFKPYRAQPKQPMKTKAQPKTEPEFQPEEQLKAQQFRATGAQKPQQVLPKKQQPLYDDDELQAMRDEFRTLDSSARSPMAENRYQQLKQILQPEPAPQEQPPRPPPSEIEPAPQPAQPKPQAPPSQPEQAPTQTKAPDAILGEQPTGTAELGGDIGSNLTTPLENLAQGVSGIASKAQEVGGNIRQGIATLTSTLDETAAATEEIPVLDVVMDVAGLFGTIFGAKALMKQKAPPPPMAVGESYEPDL
jgi:hypothetical protein